LEWNLHATDALINAPTAATPGAGQAPHVSILHLAMVQGAVYDAVNSIAGGGQPYLSDLPPAPATASKAAAAATAAYVVLIDIEMTPALPPYVVQRLHGLYMASMTDAVNEDGQEAALAGSVAGNNAAKAMFAERANDGRYVPFSFTSGTELGQWRPTPPANASDPAAWVANVEPFLIESTSQFRTKGPNALTSRAYASDYNEVKRLGSSTSSQRTPEQDAVAQFYTAHPIELFNRTFRTISEAEGLTLVQQARLFAMLNMAGADALINTWDDKAHWSSWRPITAIQAGDRDGNRLTVGDPTWTPATNTPPYPENTSGYNAVTSAYMQIAEAFFGTKRMDFSVVKIVPGGTNITRDYTRFSDVVNDTIGARVYQGIHFRTAEVQGVKVGEDVARWTVKHYFKAHRGR
jgi:hypothetical protein